MGHLKFAQRSMNKGIEQGNVLTAQIYAQTNVVILIKSDIVLN